MTTAPPRKSSPEFPVGYGDFTLISSDNVVFHFPKFLLGHVSPVFRDMFSVGSSSSSGPLELKLTEDSVTINGLLRFFDPNKKILPIDYSDQTARLFEAARKYQVKQVFDWWEKEIQIEAVSKGWKDLDNPMQVFALASRYRLPQVARVALRQLISAPSSVLQNKISFESDLFCHLIQLREQRLRWYTDQLGAWLKRRPRVTTYGGEECHTCVADESRIEGCLFRVIVLLISHPSHHILRQYKAPDTICHHLDPRNDKSGFISYPLTTLMPAAQALEKEFPKLPPGYR